MGQQSQQLLVCKMCGFQVKKLAKSHIIPESFYRAIKKDSDHLVIVSSNEDEFTKRSRTGIYDLEILCLDCERKFQVLDDYGQKILLQKQDLFKPIVFDESGKNLAWVFSEEVNLGILNKFFISILYRASLSGDVFFQHVSLGEYQGILKNFIEGLAGFDDRISVFVRKFDTSSNSFAEQVLLDPRPVRLEGVKFYQIYLGNGYVVYIKVDKRKTPEQFQKLVIGNFSELYLISGDFDQSAELNILKKIGDNLRKKSEKKRGQVPFLERRER